MRRQRGSIISEWLLGGIITFVLSLLLLTGIKACSQEEDRKQREMDSMPKRVEALEKRVQELERKQSEETKR